MVVKTRAPRSGRDRIANPIDPTHGVDSDPPVIDWRLAATNGLQKIEPLTLERIPPFPLPRTQRRPVGRFNPAAFEIRRPEPRTALDACLSAA